MRYLIMFIFAMAAGRAAADTDIGLGGHAIAKLSCSIYASASSDAAQNEQSEDLYLSGVENLRTFLEAIAQGEFTREEINGNTPMLLTWQFSALAVSTEFAAGHAVEAITSYASEKYLTYQDAGSEKFGENRPSELWGMEAANLFQTGNCAFLNTKHSIRLRHWGIEE